MQKNVIETLSITASDVYEYTVKIKEALDADGDWEISTLNQYIPQRIGNTILATLVKYETPVEVVKDETPKEPTANAIKKEEVIAKVMEKTGEEQVGVAKQSQRGRKPSK